MTSPHERAEEERRRWETDRSDSAAWDARAVVDALRKSGDAAAAVSFGEAAVAQWPAFDPLRGAMAWALYARDVASLPDEPDRSRRDRAKDAVARIQELVASDPYGKYSAWPQAALRLASAAQGRWPRSALEMLLQLDPARLSEESTKDFPSPRARWHLGVTKALEETRQWPDLKSACEAALRGDSLRIGDRRWVERRYALALENMGELRESASILRRLVGASFEWWMLADLARVLAAIGEREEAIDTCRRVLAQSGELPPRWRTAALLAELLGPDDPRGAEHVQLARSGRRQAGWPEDDSLEDQARRFGVVGEPPERIALSDLRGYWNSARDPAERTGVVKSLLPGGGSGFISTADSPPEDLYFAMPRHSNKQPPPPGSRVTFRVVDSFDRKKGQPSKRAVDIRSCDPEGDGIA